MPVNKDLAQVRIFNVDLFWNSLTLGFVEEVDLSGLKLITKDKKVGTIGDVPVGEVVIGLDGAIKATLSQVHADIYRALMPWQTTGAPIPVLPGTIHKDLYDYAQELKLHPYDLPIATTTEDWVWLKTVPRLMGGKYDGVNWNNVQAEFRVFPDRTQLTAASPLMAYGYYGGKPA